MAKIIRSDKEEVCNECKISATPEQMRNDTVRMMLTSREKMLLCECCYEEYKERWEDDF